MRSYSWLFVLFVSLFTAACADDEKVDPTSAAALHKAPSIQSGCQYMEMTRRSYGSASDLESKPQCTDYSSCDELHAPADYMAPGGGSYYQSTTTYWGVVDFLGTCDAPKPISCDGRAASNACEECVVKKDCAALVLCESDPNCTAILECIEQCGTDESCASRCAENGDYKAKKHFSRLGRAVEGCSAVCQ